MAATASGDRGQQRWPALTYQGPDHPELVLLEYAHSNEPVGLGMRPWARERTATMSAATRWWGQQVGFLGPVDPPPDEGVSGSRPAEAAQYLSTGYIGPLVDQVEFAYGDPSRAAGRRADQVVQYLQRLGPRFVVSLHADVGTRGAYAYTTEQHQRISEILTSAPCLNQDPGVEISWARLAADRVWDFFDAEVIGPGLAGPSGQYVRKIGLPVCWINLELPLFDWGADEQLRARTRAVMARQIAEGGSSARPIRLSDPFRRQLASIPTITEEDEQLFLAHLAEHLLTPI
ncbi:hypothetical protein GCM10025781_27010 [Kocuria gwangalliensis]|uniref:Uncharacterized protein n=2 Tax=Kocuria gwangalliensis TaxID=501592 RepID=A0ABP8XHJ1_9MICC